MIGIALSLARRITSSPRAQKVIAYLILAAAAALIIWGAWILFASWIASGKREAVRVDRLDTAIEAERAARNADNAAAWFDQSAAIERERAKHDTMEAINASERDPDGDPLGAALDRMR